MLLLTADEMGLGKVRCTVFFPGDVHANICIDAANNRLLRIFT